MEIRPEGTGLSTAGFAALEALLPGLLKPDLSSLIQQPGVADVVVLPQVAPADFVKLAQILTPVEISPTPQGAVDDRTVLAAKLNAEVKLDQAGQAVESAGVRKLPDWETDPRTLLQIGQSLLAKGGYPNYVRAAAVADAVQFPVEQTDAGEGLVRLAQILMPVEMPAGPQAPVDDRMILAAKANAETKLNQAEQKLPDGQADQRTLLQIAQWLFSKGGYANFVRAAALSDAVPLQDAASTDLVKLVQILTAVEMPQSPRAPVAAPQILAAKLNAEGKLEQAGQAIALAGGSKLEHEELDPQILLRIGYRLLAKGGYANYVRAAAVADTVQSAYWGATLILEQREALKRVAGPEKGAGITQSRIPISVAFSFPKTRESVRVLWRRAPLLVLLLIWLIVGVAGGVLVKSFDFEFWALGFLALVGLGFYASVRKSR